ncbi:Bacterial type II secretion system protein G [Gimesia panareensis]|uniref:Bacterial type II secretion system protein G n=1 Tax=Gimesia panareensis TaxID=2527978 RepID=A0A517Q6Q0_9PLAN|nr:type II secretion system protein GspG [Gimesia panareensis]QDT27312.1 Bacterial type II secretion system protein G [Gimesia panareensis]
MIRRLFRHLLIALLCGAVFFVIYNLAAWYNLRGERGVSSNQSFTFYMMITVKGFVEDYRKEHGSLPQDLTDLPEADQIYCTPDGKPADGWEHPLQYRHEGETYELFSYGRDGQPGGIGVDADHYWDPQNRKQPLATFRQYFLESESAGLESKHFFWSGFLGSCFVALYVMLMLHSLAALDGKQVWKPKHYAWFVLVVIVTSSAVGLVLLPLHIPTGH